MDENQQNDENTRDYLALSKGANIGRYIVVRPLGSGGMGDIYLAEDTELKRLVALKFLSSPLVSDNVHKARFLREARAVAQLNHPNIVTIHEVGEFNGRPFMAMEYVEGESLRDLIKKSPLPAEKAIDILREVSLGLIEAHSSGIIHRDIKPANILLDKKGHAKLLDFGLAVYAGAESLTKTGSTLGTVSYMSPEQVLNREIDHRSDLFSLGVVFYEMLSGILPFKGDLEAVMMFSIAHEDPEPLNIPACEQAASIQTLIDLMLCKDPKGRIQNAAELLISLDQLKALSYPIVPSKRSKKSIAVMYFQDYARSEDIGWLSKGIPHMLITSLEQSMYINVVGYQRLYDVLNQMGKGDVEFISRGVATEVARKARAAIMITGAVFKSGNSIRIDYQINDVATGRLVRAGKVIGEEAFGVADELGIEIRQELEIEETGGKVADVTTHSLEAYKYYLEGTEYYNRVNNDEAAKCFEKAIACDPTFAMAYYWMAWIAFANQGSPGNYLEKAVKYSKNLSPKEQHYIRSHEAYFRSQYTEALGHLVSITSDYPDEKMAYRIMEHIYLALRNYEELIKCCRKVISLDPSFPDSYNEMSYGFMFLGDFESALEAANKYVSLLPNEANPYDTLGEIYAYAGKPSEAIEAFKKALTIREDFNLAIEKLGTTYLQTGEFRKAEECFLKLCSRDNKTTRTMGRYYLGQLAAFQGKFREAIEIFDNVNAADPIDIKNSVWISMMYKSKAQIYLEKGQFDEALREYRESFKVHGYQASQSGHNRWFEVQVLASKGAYDEAHKTAIEIKGEIEKSVPHMFNYYFFMEAIIAFHEKRLPEALEYLHQIDLKRDPRFRLIANFIYARIMLYSGNAEVATMELERVQSTYSHLMTYWAAIIANIPYLLGIAYEAVDQPTKAAMQYQRYLDIRKEADAGIIEVEDAKLRLRRLKNDI